MNPNHKGAIKGSKGSTSKSTQMRTPGTIIIPELEDAMEQYQPHRAPWTEKDIAILKRYYCRVPMSALESTFHRGSKSIHDQVVRLGGTRGLPFEGEV